MKWLHTLAFRQQRVLKGASETLGVHMKEADFVFILQRQVGNVEGSRRGGYFGLESCYFGLPAESVVVSVAFSFYALVLNREKSHSLDYVGNIEVNIKTRTTRLAG